jgi:DNA polymerase III epsilon subunit-like protein
MEKAFYFNKVDSFYRPNLRCGRMEVKRWATICEEVRELTTKHDINVVAAYNLAFDARVIKATHKKYNGSPMFSKPVKQLDLWRVCCETLLQQKTFKKLAKKLNWISPAGNFRTNAQVAFRYGMGEWEFDESHTALDDALIETQIMAKVFKTKQKINYGLISHPWRLVQEKK